MMKMTVEEYSAELDAQMSEEEHQAQLFLELEKLALTDPLYSLAFHIPNGGYRHKATAGRMKATGVKPGIPDIFVPVARYGFHGLFIELKSLKKGAKTSAVQEERFRKLRAQGYQVTVCNGWRYALQTIEFYMGLDEV